MSIGNAIAITIATKQIVLQSVEVTWGKIKLQNSFEMTNQTFFPMFELQDKF